MLVGSLSEETIALAVNPFEIQLIFPGNYLYLVESGDFGAEGSTIAIGELQ